VSETAQRIHARHLTRYSRGIVTITDRQGLERLACGWYRIVKDEFDSITNHRPG
jgi:hypothetical protein